jgi:hypothetical protein
MRKGIRSALAGLLTAGLVTVGMLAAPAAFATSSGGAGVKASGTCSGSSTWIMTAKADNGLIEVEFEVHSGINGQTWKVRMSDNGTRIYRHAKVTKNDGSFTARKRTADLPGTDMFTGKAKNPSTGETCLGSVSF